MEEYVTKLLESGMFNSAEEIYSATIPELSAIMRGKRDRMLQDIRIRTIHAGTITAAVYNIMKGKGKPLKWDDIFKDPADCSTDDAKPREPMDPVTAYQIFRAAFGGGA